MVLICLVHFYLLFSPFHCKGAAEFGPDCMLGSGCVVACFSTALNVQSLPNNPNLAPAAAPWASQPVKNRVAPAGEILHCEVLLPGQRHKCTTEGRYYITHWSPSNGLLDRLCFLSQRTLKIRPGKERKIWMIPWASKITGHSFHCTGWQTLQWLCHSQKYR